MSEPATAKQSKQALQITEAFMFLSTPFPIPLPASRFESCLSRLPALRKHPKMLPKLLELMVQRYYQLVHHSEQFQVEQYLMFGFMTEMEQCLEAIPGVQQEIGVVTLWASITFLKKCQPEADCKQLIGKILLLMSTALVKLIDSPEFKVQSIYPQVSSAVMHYVVDNPLSHTIFGACLDIMAGLLTKLFASRQENAHASLDAILQSLRPAEQQPKAFEQECLLRLEYYIKRLSSKLPSLELGYQHKTALFVEALWPIAFKFNRLLVPVAILGEVSGQDMGRQYEKLPSSSRKMVEVAITHEFLQMLVPHNSTILERSSTLKRLERLAGRIAPSIDESAKMVQSMATSLYLVHNNRSLIVPHTSLGESISLADLAPGHSFGTYPLPLEGLLSMFDFEMERVLVTRLPYAESSLGNVTALKNILLNLGEQTKNNLLQVLLEEISRDDCQYMVDMSLTRFCQLLTRVVMIYWLVKSRPRLRANIALGLLQTLSGSQALRILRPSFDEEQLLMGCSLLICYTCYQSLLQPSAQLSAVKKLRLKILTLECVLNNIKQASSMVRSAAYYIMLSEAAPGAVGECMANLQSTLINRNISNLEFIAAVLGVCELSPGECEDLAHKFMSYTDSYKLVRLLLPKLSTQTARKCLLSATSEGGRWAHMLSGNCSLLLNRQLASSETQSREEKYENFHMNDGPNVRVTNALGVVLLELGERWQHALHPDCPYREIVLDLLVELASLEPGMVFFKNRFYPVLECLYAILIRKQQGSSGNSFAEHDISSTRLNCKIYKIMARIPLQNYVLFTKKDRQRSKSKPATKSPHKTSLKQQFFVPLLEYVQTGHKKLRLEYMTNSANKTAALLYELSDSIIDKLKQALEQANEHLSDQKP